MAFTEFETSTANISGLSDRPNQNDGLSSAQLKGRFDKAGTDIKTYINDVLLDELARTTDGDSGADNIGITKLTPTGPENIQDELERQHNNYTGLASQAVLNNGDQTISGTKDFVQETLFEGGLSVVDNYGKLGGISDDGTIFGNGVIHTVEHAGRVYLKLNPNGNVSELLQVADAGSPYKKVWHEMNDGAGSGLDADKLDGQEGSYYVDIASNQSISGAKSFSQKITVPTPTTATEAANKTYVDTADANFYTKSQLQNSGLSLVHWGNLTDVPNLADAQWKTPVATKSDLPVDGNSLGDNRVVLDDGDGKQAVYTCVDTTGAFFSWSKVGDVDWMTEEATRQTQETARVNAEGAESPKSGRVGAEIDRVAAENARILAEGTADSKTGRIGAELDRVDAENARKSAEILRQAHINDKDNPHEVTAAQAGAVATTDIADDLTTDDPARPLSAKQGKVLADIVSTNLSKISTINFNIGAYLDDFIPLGASWDKGEVPTLTRTDFAVGKVANIGIDSQVVQNDFDSASIYREIIEIEDSLGNKFVRIPKFYIKKTDGVGFKTWSISKYKHQGFYLPWCFWDFTNSRELPYIDVGKYNASLNGTKLASVANTYPLISKNIVEFRGYAQANNAGGLLGYQQLDVHVIDILRTLFFIEFGTLDLQAIMQGYTEGQHTATHLATATEAGTNRIVVANAHADLYRVGQTISVGTTQGGNQIFYGRAITGITVVDESNKAVEFDGDPVDIAAGNLLYNTGWKSGFSSNIVASSGCIVANDGKYPCSYRGIENPFGSVWQFVDGVNITDNQAWVCKDAGQYASNVFASPYEKLSYVNLNASGYGPVEMGYDSNLPFAEFATSVTGGSTSKHYCDRYYHASGSIIARFGGRWISGVVAGLSCWGLDISSSSTYIDMGGRLIHKPL